MCLCRSNSCGSARGVDGKSAIILIFRRLKFRNFVWGTLWSAARLAALGGSVSALRFRLLGFSERSKSANGEKRDVRGKPSSTRREEAGGALGSDFHSRGDFVLLSFGLAERRGRVGFRVLWLSSVLGPARRDLICPSISSAGFFIARSWRLILTISRLLRKFCV